MLDERSRWMREVVEPLTSGAGSRPQSPEGGEANEGPWDVAGWQIWWVLWGHVAVLVLALVMGVSR